jgi:hypothetical protein
LDKLLEKDKDHDSILELVVNFFIECTSLADLITDFQVILILVQGFHIAWASINILCILSAYFVSFAPIITCFIQRNFFQQKGTAFSVSFLTPFILVYFLLIDIIYIFFGLISSFIIIILHVFYLITKVKTQSLKEFIENYLDSIF